MKIISDCTEVISSSDDRKVILCEYAQNDILSNGEDENEKCATLEKNISTFEIIKDCISRINNSDEELSQNCTKLVIKNQNQSPRVEHINEPTIDEKFVKSNSCGVKRTDLDEAFKNCILEIEDNDDLSLRNDDIFNELVELTENGLTPSINLNLHNYKRKILLSNIDDSSSCCDTTCDHLYFNKAKKICTIEESSNAISRPQSCQEITVDIPKVLEPYKNTLETFLQKHICLILPTIDKCIECRIYQMKNHITSDYNYDYENIICRFYAFRQLKFTESGTLVVAGYPDPYNNIISTADLGLWLPSPNLSISSKINIEASMKILEDTGGQFCKFVEDEKEALELNWTNNQEKRKVVWKKCVNGVREMCDVCKTSIFNHHWSCGKCGFVVCVDCFRNKLESNNNQFTTISSIKRRFGKKIWLLCSDQVEHQVDQLSITQILAGDSLYHVSRLMHETCVLYKIPLDCNCIEHLRSTSPDLLDVSPVTNISPNNECENICSNNDGESRLSISIKKNYSKFLKFNDINKVNRIKSKIRKTILFPILYPPIMEDEVKDEDESDDEEEPSIPIIPNTCPQLSISYSNTIESYMWLCEGHLLFLLDPKNYYNYEIFQKQWKRGQPVLARGVGNNLSPSLWHPKSFSRDFGHQNNDLINCITCKVVPDQPMYKFWDGFEDASARLLDKLGQPMLLKLKDWPPSADFAETLPDRFQDLMNCLPLKEYTQRNGKFNLAARLPECFVPPDLGPKMYTAYGNAGTKHKKVGTTNLHLDISDAVNVMVYVAITKNCQEYDYDWYVRKASQVIEEAGCDDLTKRRVFVHGEIPGALWHIYHASDADCIRDLLNKVAIEQGDPLEQFSDPIHDQSHYLDEYLRDRLFKEYGIKGYAIVQCYGDAIFIPAGAPHQVRNLHNCIKVAEDFVSPENIHQSFRMTQEFRNLTDSHTNHEDKLQIKNIVYHAVKDSISVLKYHNEH